MIQAKKKCSWLEETRRVFLDGNTVNVIKHMQNGHINNARQGGKSWGRTAGGAEQTQMRLFSLYFQISNLIRFQGNCRTWKLKTVKRTGGASSVEKIFNQIWKASAKGRAD